MALTDACRRLACPVQLLYTCDLTMQKRHCLLRLDTRWSQDTATISAWRCCANTLNLLSRLEVLWLTRGVVRRSCPLQTNQPAGSWWLLDQMRHREIKAMGPAQPDRSGRVDGDGVVRCGCIAPRRLVEGS